MQGYIVLALVFAIIIAVFAVQNTMMVVIRFFLWEANTSLVIVVLVAAAIGAVMLFLVNLLKNIGTKKEMKDLRRQVALLTTEKDKLQKAQAALPVPAESAGSRESAGSTGLPDPAVDAGRREPAENLGEGVRETVAADPAADDLAAESADAPIK